MFSVILCVLHKTLFDHFYNVYICIHIGLRFEYRPRSIFFLGNVTLLRFFKLAVIY